LKLEFTCMHCKDWIQRAATVPSLVNVTGGDREFI